MKKLFTALLLLVGFVSFSQTKGYFRYDSIQFEKVGGNAEFILLNSTRNVTNGVLTNLGNGRTGFVVPSGSGGLSGGNLGSQHRLYVPGSSGIKTVGNLYNIIYDSATTNILKIGVDTTVGIGIVSWPRYLKKADSVNAVFTPMSRSLTGGYGINTIGDLSANRTISTDTSTIQPKNLLYPTSVQKTGITVRLKGDSSGLANYSYGFNAAGTLQYNRTLSYDSSAMADSAVLMWKASQSKLVFTPYPYGGGSYTTPFRIQFFPGARTRDPAVGDSVVQRDTFQGRCIEFIHRNGYYWLEGDTLQGYTYVKATGTITFHPKLAANEKIEIKFGNCSDTAQIPSPPATWVDLSIGTNTGTLINTSHVWTTTGSFGWANYGLDALRLTGDGSIRAQYVATDGHEFVLGFNATNSSQDYTNYEYGVYVASSGALSKVVNGTSSSISYSLSVGDYVRINRTGSTFKIQSSPDGNTWTDRWTFVATSSATHYVNLDIYQTGKCYYPQGFGLVP